MAQPRRLLILLPPYVENGARIFNIAARGENEETCIDTIADVSAILHNAFPEL